MKIFLVGGGTGGPIIPLLAVTRALRQIVPKCELFFVGNNFALEKKFLDQAAFEFKYLTISAGKRRRYFSFENFIDLFRTLFGFLKSLYLVRKYQPDIVFGAGSFVQVPLAWAAFFSRVPVVVHQPDVDLLFSTRLVAPIARAVTVSFMTSSKDLPEFSGLFKKIKKSKVFVTGNPIRQEVLGGTKPRARKLFALNHDYPTVLVMGGGTGALTLNQVVLEALPELLRYVQVIHITGGRTVEDEPSTHPHYHAFDFLGGELKHAYAVADLVICRGGMGTITELSALGKPAIIIPLPQSPQEDNVRFLAYFRCAVGLFQEFLTPELLVGLVRKILWNKEIQETLRSNIQKLMPKDADQQIAKLLLKIYNESR